MTFKPLALAQVGVLPVHDKETGVWSILRFSTDLHDNVWMSVDDDTDHAEKVPGYPSDGAIRKAMIPYLRQVARTGHDPLGLVKVKGRQAVPTRQGDTKWGTASVEWDFEVVDGPDGIHVTRVRRGPGSPWTDPAKAPASVQDFLVLTDYDSKPGKRTYAGTKMRDVDHWPDVNAMVTDTDYPRREEDVALRAMAGQSAEGSVRWYPDDKRARRGSVTVEMPAGEWRRYRYPRAEAKRMLQEFG
jgi:hypothetical protein